MLTGNKNKETTAGGEMEINPYAYDLIKHDDPWREKFGGIECLVCEDKVPYGSEVYNEGGTNDFVCVACVEEAKAKSKK